jgi:hypothetical protein
VSPTVPALSLTVATIASYSIHQGEVISNSRQKKRRQKKGLTEMEIVKHL